MSSADWLKENLQRVFELPQPAVEWLMMLWQAAQFFDDVADGDRVERSDLNATLWNLLVAMHQNPFWVAHAQNLTPVVATTILKWQASDRIEREGDADAKSFVWRAGFYDVVLMVVALCHGTHFATENAHHVIAMYGEQFEDYMKEFGNA